MKNISGYNDNMPLPDTELPDVAPITKTPKRHYGEVLGLLVGIGIGWVMKTSHIGNVAPIKPVTVTKQVVIYRDNPKHIKQVHKMIALQDRINRKLGIK